jgi:hypothetical protein
VLETLEEEVRELELRRQSIECDNAALKKAIQDMRSRSVPEASVSPMATRKGAFLTDPPAHRESKFQYRTARNLGREKERRCCACCTSCLLM